MISKLSRRLAPAAFAFAAATSALAQGPQSPVCQRLEGQLNTFDRSANDPARAEQARRYEETIGRQQADLDRLSAQSKRLNCEGGFFVLFTGQSPQCGPLTGQIQQLRANIERGQSELARLQGSGPERDAQRRAILVALSQNDCGAQYRAAVAATQPRGGFFESLFGSNSIFSSPTGPGGDMPGFGGPGGTYRTICVRTCDGYYYPISFATSPARFIEDARTCQRSCPAAEVQLYSHRNPGEDVNQAVSVSTQVPYTSLPSAFKYRQAFDASCSCKKPGETWAQALKEDVTIERGDIVVNDERARQLSQPRVDAQGKPIRPDAPPSPANVRSNPRTPGQTGQPPAATSDTPPAEEGSDKPDPKRKVRAVGPTFIPAR